MSRPVAVTGEPKRVSVMITDEIDEMIIELKKTDRFARSSYSEVVRQILLIGLKRAKSEKK